MGVEYPKYGAGISAWLQVAARMVNVKLAIGVRQIIDINTDSG